jgi:dipeptidyl aminopeptidase/acylaminoacyl peptidase
MLSASLLGVLLLTCSVPARSQAADTVKVVAAADKLIPVGDFFKAPQFSKAQLSPDGKYVAMLVADSNDRLLLAVTAVDVIAPKVLVRYTNVDVGQFYWVNNRRLVYGLADSRSGLGDTHVGSGLYAVDIDGENKRQLINRGGDALSTGTNIKSRILSQYFGFSSTIAVKDTNDVYVTEFIPSGTTRRNTFNLHRLDTVTGIASLIKGPGEVEQWLVDRSGVPRLTMVLEKGKRVAYLKDNKTEQWRKLFESDSDDEEGIEPGFFGTDGNLYVTAYQGKDTRSLYRYDVASNKIEAEPVVSLDGYDYNGLVIFNQTNKKILGFHYETDAPGTLWLDEGYKQIQKKIDDLLPGKVNRISIRTEGDSDTVLVYSFADADPGSIMLFNHKTDKITVLGQTRPWIKPQQMAYQDAIKYKARDGLTIPGYLTLPKGNGKNLPMVVLVHGGPNVRGEHWGWNPEAQFLASRGYAVLQVEFRGSTGYGLKHEKLGWKQWGLTMQDDVTDGTQWAIAQGIADPKRICIAGASYGGYATLLGLIREQNLYQCGIAWVAVTDLSYRYTITWSDSNDDVTDYYLPKKVGDFKKDAEQFKATSAVVNAAKLTQPLILAYGGVDRRVPLEHGTRLREALKGHNPNVQWILYNDEGHGWTQLNNNVDFWTKAENLLADTTQKK